MGLLYLRNKETGVFEAVRVLQGPPGERGAQGEQGEQGVGIASIEHTIQLGNLEYYTITLDDGSTYQFAVTNGQDGYTPIKGVDYFTEEEIQEIVNEVLSALPAAEEASF